MRTAAMVIVTDPVIGRAVANSAMDNGLPSFAL